MPLRLSLGVTGNLGGLDDRADPDKLIDTWLTKRDNSLRANLTANWLLSKSWITNIELNASATYSDNRQREKRQYHSAVSGTSMHAHERGYYMAEDFVPGADNPAVRIVPGTRYNVMGVDDRPLSAKVTLKANWSKNVDRFNSKLKIGADWTLDKNFGTGAYSEDEATADTYRTWRYCDVPAMTNIAAYAEENLMIRTGDDARLNLIAGIRWDNTIIPSSAYGVTSSLSPRFNAKYTFFSEKNRKNAFLPGYQRVHFDGRREQRGQPGLLRDAAQH